MLMKALSVSVCATKLSRSKLDKEGIVPPEKSLVIYSAVNNSRALGD